MKTGIVGNKRRIALFILSMAFIAAASLFCTVSANADTGWSQRGENGQVTQNPDGSVVLDGAEVIRSGVDINGGFAMRITLLSAQNFASSTAAPMRDGFVVRFAATEEDLGVTGVEFEYKPFANFIDGIEKLMLRTFGVKDGVRKQVGESVVLTLGDAQDDMGWYDVNINRKYGIYCLWNGFENTEIEYLRFLDMSDGVVSVAAIASENGSAVMRIDASRTYDIERTAGDRRYYVEDSCVSEFSYDDESGTVRAREAWNSSFNIYGESEEFSDLGEFNALRFTFSEQDIVGYLDSGDLSTLVFILDETPLPFEEKSVVAYLRACGENSVGGEFRYQFEGNLSTQTVDGFSLRDRNELVYLLSENGLTGYLNGVKVFETSKIDFRSVRQAGGKLYFRIRAFNSGASGKMHDIEFKTENIFCDFVNENLPEKTRGELYVLTGNAAETDGKATVYEGASASTVAPVSLKKGVKLFFEVQNPAYNSEKGKDGFVLFSLKKSSANTGFGRGSGLDVAIRFLYSVPPPDGHASVANTSSVTAKGVVSRGDDIYSESDLAAKKNELTVKKTGRYDSDGNSEYAIVLNGQKGFAYGEDIEEGYLQMCVVSAEQTGAVLTVDSFGELVKASALESETSTIELKVGQSCAWQVNAKELFGDLTELDYTVEGDAITYYGGVITAHSEGEAVIRAKAGDLEFVCSIKVSALGGTDVGDVEPAPTPKKRGCGSCAKSISLIGTAVALGAAFVIFLFCKRRKNNEKN